MNFQQSKQYLLNLGNEVLTMKLGLENIGKMLAALGNPHEKYLKIQVVGTNGKGSTCAFLDAICYSAGIKTGLLTSPHLISVTERIKINGVEISEAKFAEHATKVRLTAEELLEKGELENVPTFFEQITAIALSAFAAESIELAILETGLGGRYDATTAANAEIAAITPIDYDHQKYLGETLTEIAGEKAAIIRENMRVVTVPQSKEVEKVIFGRCREVGVEPMTANGEITVKKYDLTEVEPLITVNFKTAAGNYHDVILSLRGRHQLTNALLAISTAETLAAFDFKISNENIVNGLETARHKGRLEFYDGILFDGAHNAAGARALRDYLDEFIKQPVIMVFGAMNDKNLQEIGDVLFPKAETLILTEPDNPRSMPTARLSEFVPPDFSREKVYEISKVADALKFAREMSNDGSLICVTGSLYLIGEAQKVLSESVH